MMYRMCLESISRVDRLRRRYIKYCHLPIGHAEPHDFAYEHPRPSRAKVVPS